MTLVEIADRIRRVKPCSLIQVRRYVRRLHIKPVGKLRSRPQMYPADTAEQILLELGFDDKGRIPTVDQLRAERSKSLKSRRAA